jgi:hypothetical protein
MKFKGFLGEVAVLRELVAAQAFDIARLKEQNLQLQS